MESHKKFTIYGPKDTLKHLGPQLKSNTKPQYYFCYKHKNVAEEIYVFIFEEHQKLINSSTTVNVILKIMEDSVEIDFIVTGGRMGFRGSAITSDRVEPLIQDTVNEFFIDFSKRHGLTMQENIQVQSAD